MGPDRHSSGPSADWPPPDPARRHDPAPPEPGRRYLTPTGAPCVRTVRVDGAIEGSGDCCACGTCLLLLETWG